MVALVVRVEDMPETAVPSRVIACDLCGADCWLSLYSGDSTLRLAAATGDSRVCCGRCLESLLQGAGND